MCVPTQKSKSIQTNKNKGIEEEDKNNFLNPFLLPFWILFSVYKTKQIK